MTLYYIRCVKTDWYQLAKFEDRNRPEEVYDIVGGKCDCPASWRGPCKHLKLLARWKEQVAKALPHDMYAYDTTTDSFVKLPFDDTKLAEILKDL